VLIKPFLLVGGEIIEHGREIESESLSPSTLVCALLSH
jgi:hypothetical protein